MGRKDKSPEYTAVEQAVRANPTLNFKLGSIIIAVASRHENTLSARPKRSWWRNERTNAEYDAAQWEYERNAGLSRRRLSALGELAAGHTTLVWSYQEASPTDGVVYRGNGPAITADLDERQISITVSYDLEEGPVTTVRQYHEPGQESGAIIPAEGKDEQALVGAARELYEEAERRGPAGLKIEGTPALPGEYRGDMLIDPDPGAGLLENRLGAL